MKKTLTSVWLVIVSWMCPRLQPTNRRKNRISYSFRFVYSSWRCHADQLTWNTDFFFCALNPGCPQATRLLTAPSSRDETLQRSPAFNGKHRHVKTRNYNFYLRHSLHTTIKIWTYKLFFLLVLIALLCITHCFIILKLHFLAHLK